MILIYWVCSFSLVFVGQDLTDLARNWPFFFNLRPGPAKLACVFYQRPDWSRFGQTTKASHFSRQVKPISLAIHGWQTVVWKVYLFAFRYFILYLHVSDVKLCNMKLIKFLAVITNKWNSHEFIAVSNDLKPFFFVGPDLFGLKDLSDE